MKEEIINILFLIPCIGDGGIESMVISWIMSLDPEKYHVDVFTQHIVSSKTKNKLESMGTIIYSSECRKRNIRIKKEFYKKILKEKKYTIVHLHTCFAPEFMLLKWSKESDVRIRIAHGHNALEHKTLKEILIQKISHPFMRYYATEYCGCTDKAAVEILGKKGRESKHYQRINNSIDTDKLRFSQEDRNKIRSDLGIEDKYVLGHIGRMTKQKNHLFLLDIFHECQNLRQNTVLLLIGDGELRAQIEKKAQRLGIIEKIIFVGITNKIPQYLSAMDHFLFPSLYEGFSIALLEAQCSGLTCTVSSEIIHESLILNTARSVKLDEDVKVWAEIVCSSKNLSNRELAANIIKEKGYDIADNDLNNYYQNILRG